MKHCIKCGETNADERETCWKCNEPLPKPEKVESWMYLIAFLIPLAGIILGCIKVGQKDNEGGKKLILIAILGAVIFAGAWYLKGYFLIETALID